MGFALKLVTARLTPRQRQIIRVLLPVSTNREIANRLGFAAADRQESLSVIYSKLGVRNRLELAVHAGRDGLLDRERDD